MAINSTQVQSPAHPGAPRYRRSRLFSGPMLGYLLVAPPLLIVVFLIFFPALQSFGRTLTEDASGATVGLSFTRYAAFFSDRTSVSNLIFTVEVTVISVIVLFLVCFPLAIYLRFSNSWIANAVQVLALFPLFVPGIILAYALIRFVGPHGMFETALSALGLTGYHTPYLKPQGIIIGLVWENIPFSVLVLTAGLRQLDDSLIESARDVGASDLEIFWRIILPLLQRPAMIVFCLDFIGIFGSYTLPYLLGPAAPMMMGVFMQQTFTDFHLPRDAETQAVITFLVSAVVGLLYVRTISRQRTGKDEE